MDDKDMMKLERQAFVHKHHNRLALYHTVLRGYDDKIKLYCNLWSKEYATLMLEDAGKGFKKVGYPVEKSGISHNFYPFMHDGKYYAIGGVDSWKLDKYWIEVDNFAEFVEKFESTFKTPYTRNEQHFEKFQEKMRTKPHVDHVDGLYLLESGNGAGWDVKQRIITSEHPGFHSALDWGKSSEFDGHLSCVFHNGLFYLYLRDNIRKKFRFIQYATSPDLITWSEFKPIHVEGRSEKFDNYYSPVIMKHPKENIFIGTIPYYHEHSWGCIRFIRSEDGINWEITGKAFKESVAMLQGAMKNKKMFVNGVIPQEKHVDIYVHENYLGLERVVPVNIVKYKVTWDEFNRNFKC